MKNKIIGLIRLQDCDNKIKEIDVKKRERPLKIQKLEDDFNAVEMRFQEELDRLESLKKDRRIMEQDVQDMENKLEKSQIKLNAIKSNKEYTAVLKEIEDLGREKSLMEDKLLQLMEMIEDLEKKCLESRDELEKLKKKFDLDKKGIEKEIESFDKESGVLEKRRMEFCDAIDQDLLDRYLFLKGRKGGLAIGSVVEGVCQVCNIRIPPQQFNELIKGHSLLTCPSCNRLIYWGENKYFINVLKA
ncbi:zinc ribbon domain-containing protein [Thermodesulfobacteriota bacterium]